MTSEKVHRRPPGHLCSVDINQRAVPRTVAPKQLPALQSRSSHATECYSVPAPELRLHIDPYHGTEARGRRLCGIVLRLCLARCGARAKERRTAKEGQRQQGTPGSLRHHIALPPRSTV